MLNEDTIQYAMENTQVILAPQRRIDTFGTTSFRFYLITEMMDRANEVRIRDGRLLAEKPRIITPGQIQRTLLEGFGERAEAFVDWLRDHARHMAFLNYQFSKTNVTENIVHDPVNQVVDRLRQVIDRSEDPLSAIIHGVDEGWEVCLLKFAADLIQDSAGDNLGDFRRRGWI